MTLQPYNAAGPPLTSGLVLLVTSVFMTLQPYNAVYYTQDD